MTTKQALLAEFMEKMKEEDWSWDDVSSWLSAALDRVERETLKKAEDVAYGITWDYFCVKPHKVEPEEARLALNKRIDAEFRNLRDGHDLSLPTLAEREESPLTN